MKSPQPSKLAQFLADRARKWRVGKLSARRIPLRSPIFKFVCWE